MAGDEILKVSGHKEIRNSILYTNFETITVLIDQQAVSGLKYPNTYNICGICVIIRLNNS